MFMTADESQAIRQHIPGLACLFVFMLGWSGAAQIARSEEAALLRGRANPRLPVRVQVVDPQGRPVRGAVVRARGLRTKAERVSWHSWIPERHGEPATGETNIDGLVELTYPKFVLEELETGEVDWLVDHADYVVTADDLKVDADLGVVKLRRGHRIAVTAVRGDTGDRILSDLFAVLSGGSFNDVWKMYRNGTLVSRTVARDRNRLRIVHLPDDGPALFSRVVNPADSGNSQRVLLRNIPLFPGTRLQGRLSDTVPRPVPNGHVAVRVMQHAGIRQSEKRLNWRHWVPIQADGSFVVESLPADSIAQIIAVCDGWISSRASPESLEYVGLAEFRGQVHHNRVTPQVFPVVGEEVSCEISMEQAASCRVSVVTMSGVPIEHAAVSLWPNQMWLSGGSQLVGAGFCTDRFLKLTADQQRLLQHWSSWQMFEELGVMKSLGNVYQQTTDANGVAVIRLLPGGTAEHPRHESILVEHHDYEQPPYDGLHRSTSVELLRDRTAEVTVRMDPKGTTVIGR